MSKKRAKKRTAFILVNAFLLLTSLLCFVGSRNISGMLLSQSAAGRWQGESEMKFAQISCFLPTDQQIDEAAVNNFRQVMTSKFKEASLDALSSERLFDDSWSTYGKVSVSSSLGSGEVYAYAVGGDFFLFHPLRLRSGNYISADDLMRDRVLLDEETAWLLFGGNDIHGQSFNINGEPFVVAGVVQREDDFATKKAYADGMGIFMSYEAFKKLNADAGIQCYEVVMPESVNGFAYSIASDKFPIGRGEIVNNSTRFSFSKLLKLSTQYGMRSMQNKGIIYPYWENAARYAEDIAALLTALSLLLAVLPLGWLLVMFIRLLIYGKNSLESSVFPKLKENAEEKIRQRQYERLHKKH